MNIKQIVSEMFRYIRGNYQLPVVEKQVYSTAETVVGVWTDGKPLYRKVVDFGTLPNKSTKSIAHGIEDIETIVRYECTATNIDGNTIFHVPTVSVQNATYQISAELTKTEARILTGAIDRTNYTAIFIIEYTKTTDTPTQTIVPLEFLIEYSTDEKLIGYWIDGKPIYELTYMHGGTFNAGTSWTNIPTPVILGNIDSIVSGYLIRTSQIIVYPVQFSFNSGSVRVELSKGINDFKGYVIRYTKTTDTP